MRSTLSSWYHRNSSWALYSHRLRQLDHLTPRQKHLRLESAAMRSRTTALGRRARWLQLVHIVPVVATASLVWLIQTRPPWTGALLIGHVAMYMVGFAVLLLSIRWRERAVRDQVLEDMAYERAHGYPRYCLRCHAEFVPHHSDCFHCRWSPKDE